MSTTSYTFHPPFTTPLTAPSSCTDSLADNGIWTDSVGNYRPVLQAVYPQDSACFAPGWTSAANAYAKGANFWAGNPLCPSGQSVAQTYSSADVTTAGATSTPTATASRGPRTASGCATGRGPRRPRPSSPGRFCPAASSRRALRPLRALGSWSRRLSTFSYTRR